LLREPPFSWDGVAVYLIQPEDTPLSSQDSGTVEGSCLVGWACFGMITRRDKPMAKYVLWGSYCDNALEKRPPYREAHLQGLQAQKEQGILVALGPTTDNRKVFGIYDAEDEATVRQLVEADPYWQNGIWTDYEIHAWNQVF
jgi:uncharacterized protein YciI